MLKRGLFFLSSWSMLLFSLKVFSKNHSAVCMTAHHESWMNSGTNLELTVICWQSAQVVCPREHFWCVRMCVHVRVNACVGVYVNDCYSGGRVIDTHTSQFYHFELSECCWTLLSVLSALLMNWNGAHFPFLCILLFAPNTHLISTLRSLLPPQLPPLLLMSMSTEANCQSLWDRFWQDFEHS